MPPMPITPTLREVLRDGPAVAAHRPWPRVVVGRRKPGSMRSACSGADTARCSGSGARQAFVHMALHRRRARGLGDPQPRVRRRTVSRRWDGCTRPRSDWSERIRDLVGAGARGPCRTRARGSTTASGRCDARSGEADRATVRAEPLRVSARRPAKACIRFRSARFTPASSNPVTSASRRTARRSCASRSDLATCTRGSNR